MTQPLLKRLATEGYVQSVLTALPAATSSARGSIKLAGDLAGTADAPTVPGLATLTTALTDRPLRIMTKRTITGAYTLVIGDATDMLLHTTAASAMTITIPSNASVAFTIETVIPWRQFNTGLVTFAGASGVTLNARGGAVASAGQYAEGIITKVATNIWVLSGDIA